MDLLILLKKAFTLCNALSLFPLSQPPFFHPEKCWLFILKMYFISECEFCVNEHPFNRKVWSIRPFQNARGLHRTHRTHIINTHCTHWTAYNVNDYSSLNRLRSRDFTSWRDELYLLFRRSRELAFFNQDENVSNLYLHVKSGKCERSSFMCGKLLEIPTWTENWQEVPSIKQWLHNSTTLMLTWKCCDLWQKVQYKYNSCLNRPIPWRSWMPWTQPVSTYDALAFKITTLKPKLPSTHCTVISIEHCQSL